MPRLQRARLQHGRQRLMVLGEDRDHLVERHGAVADRAAHQPKALVGELHVVVLEMDVPTCGAITRVKSSGASATGKLLPVS